MMALLMDASCTIYGPPGRIVSAPMSLLHLSWTFALDCSRLPLFFYVSTNLLEQIRLLLRYCSSLNFTQAYVLLPDARK